MAAKKGVCKDCAYFKAHPQEDKNFGHCHRFPPILLRRGRKNIEFTFPAVGEFHWCGEWKHEKENS